MKDADKFTEHFFLMKRDIFKPNKDRTLDIFHKYHVRIIIMTTNYNTN